eukprot:SAG22_NODE_549_length_9239_cov_7.477899_2_plen_125_part_00
MHGRAQVFARVSISLCSTTVRWYSLTAAARCSASAIVAGPTAFGAVPCSSSLSSDCVIVSFWTMYDRVHSMANESFTCVLLFLLRTVTSLLDHKTSQLNCIKYFGDSDIVYYIYYMIDPCLHKI